MTKGEIKRGRSRPSGSWSIDTCHLPPAIPDLTGHSRRRATTGRGSTPPQGQCCARRRAGPGRCMTWPGTVAGSAVLPQGRSAPATAVVSIGSGRRCRESRPGRNGGHSPCGPRNRRPVHDDGRATHVSGVLLPARERERRDRVLHDESGRGTGAAGFTRVPTDEWAWHPPFRGHAPYDLERLVRPTCVPIARTDQAHPQGFGHHTHQRITAHPPWPRLPGVGPRTLAAPPRSGLADAVLAQRGAGSGARVCFIWFPRRVVL
ncbi:hypothetical protein STENM223S_03112 [Streptomyces tendae]